MYGPTSRVLTVLEILQARGTVPAAELAEQLEVEPRTVRRYVSALRDLGIPVGSTPGRHGGYQLGPGSKLPPLMFSDGEALAVVVSLLLNLSWTTTRSAEANTASALEKIHRVLPQKLRRQMVALRESLEFTNLAIHQFGSFDATATDVSTVIAIALAQHLQQRISIRYRSARGDETTRQVDVYGLIHHVTTWYTVGWCHLRHDLRVFRLDRILSLQTVSETFERPEEFDAREHILRSLATAPYRWHVEVAIDATLEQLQPLIPDGLAVLQPSADGVVLKSGFEHLDQFARFIVSLGYPFRIIRPDELRDEVRRIGQALLETAGR